MRLEGDERPTDADLTPSRTLGDRPVGVEDKEGSGAVAESSPGRVIEGLSVREVERWLWKAGMLPTFEECLPSLKEPLTEEALCRSLFEMRLNPYEAQKLLQTFYDHRRGPVFLNLGDDEGSIGIYFFGKGGGGHVVLGRDMRETQAVEQREGKVGCITRRERYAVYKILQAGGNESGKRLERLVKLTHGIHKIHGELYPGHSLLLLPEILRPPDFDSVDSDSPVVVFRYRPGYDMGKMLKARGIRPLPFLFVCNYAAQAARALYITNDLHRHAKLGKELIHRDLKPENRFVDDEGQLMTLDYGMVRRDEASESIKATEGPAALGTIDYMAPEVASGKTATIKADVFSFGCELYRMLTGSCPYPRRAGAAIQEALIARAHIYSTNSLVSLELPGPDDLRVRKDPILKKFAEKMVGDPNVRARVTEVCRFICEKMLHPNPEERATPEELVEFFLPRCCYGGVCGNKWQKFVELGAVRDTGFLLADVPPFPEGQMPIPSRFSTPEQMLNSLIDGSESVEGKEGAYDWLRDLPLDQRDSTRTVSIREDEVPTVPLWKRKSVLAGAAATIGAATLWGAMLLLSGGKDGENGNDRKDDPPGKKEPEKIAKQPKLREPLRLPSRPQFLAFDEKVGMMFFDTKGKERRDRVDIRCWISLKMSGLGVDVRDEPMVYVAFAKSAIFENPVRLLRPELFEGGKLTWPEPVPFGKERPTIIYRHPTLPRFIVHLPNQVGSMYVDQSDLKPVTRFFLPRELGSDENLRSVFDAYGTETVTDYVKDSYFSELHGRFITIADYVDKDTMQIVKIRANRINHINDVLLDLQNKALKKGDPPGKKEVAPVIARRIFFDETFGLRFVDGGKERIRIPVENLYSVATPEIRGGKAAVCYCGFVKRAMLETICERLRPALKVPLPNQNISFYLFVHPDAPGAVLFDPAFFSVFSGGQKDSVASILFQHEFSQPQAKELQDFLKLFRGQRFMHLRRKVAGTVPLDKKGEELMLNFPNTLIEKLMGYAGILEPGKDAERTPKDAGPQKKKTSLAPRRDDLLPVGLNGHSVGKLVAHHASDAQQRVQGVLATPRDIAWNRRRPARHRG